MPSIDLLDGVLLLQLDYKLIALGLELLRQIFIKELLHVIKFRGIFAWLLKSEAIDVLVSTKELFNHSSYFVSLLGLVCLDPGWL